MTSVEARGGTAPRPLWLGALVAPLVAPMALLLGLAVMGLAAGERITFNSVVEVGAYVLVIGLPVASAGMWLLGLPCAWLLRRWRRMTLPALIVAGMPSGALGFVLLLQWAGSSNLRPMQVGVGAALGAVVAAAFGLVCGASWRR